MSSYKTNWQLEETVMPEDMNRIEGNIKENNKKHSDFKTEYDKTLKEQNKKIDAKSEKSDVVLKVPKRLSSIDLNTVCTAGNYIIANATNAPTQYGRLVVLQWDTSAKWVTQVLYSDTTNEVYTRCSLNEFATSWTPWQKLLNISEGDSRYFRTYIDGISTDFNNAKTQGVYHVSGDFENAPQSGNIYGVLEVIARDKHRTQRFTDINNNVWNRFYNSGSNTWTSWSKIYSEANKPTWNDIQNKPNSFLPSSHTHDDRYVNKELGIVTDFNLCTKTGIYKVANPQPFKNGPSGSSTYGELEVYEYTAGAEYLQRYTDANGNIYTRFKNSSTWRNWQKFYSENNKPTWNDINNRPDTYPPSTHNHDDKYLLKDMGIVKDFNSCISPGIYTISTGSTLPNAPITGSMYGTLEVIPRGTDFIQRVTTSGGQEYYRYYGNDSLKFRAWTKVFNSSVKPTWNDVQNKPSSFTPSSHNHDDRYLQYHRGDIGSSSDFNNAVAEGIYGIGYDNTIPNAPISGGLYGTLEVMSKPREIIQRVTNSVGEIWIRFRNWQGTWNGWNQITTIRDFTGTNGQDSNWQRLPNGLFIQWGTVLLTFSNNKAVGDLIYPIAFKDSAIHVIGNVASAQHLPYADANAAVSNQNNTRGYIEITDLYGRNRTGEKVRVNWIAIGK